SRRELNDRQATFMELRPECADRFFGHRNGLEPEVGPEAELGDEAVEALPIGGASVDRDTNPARNDVDGSRLDIDHPYRGHRPVHGCRNVTHLQDVDGGRHQSVETAEHRDGARMPDVPFEGALSADDADDPHRESQRSARPLQHRPLLDVHLEEALRQRAARDEGGAPDTAALLVSKNGHGSLPDALDRLDRRDDPERTVELPSEGHRIQMRAGPDARL